MIELAFMVLALGLAGIGIALEQRMFTFVSGVLFLFFGIASISTNVMLGVVLVALGFAQIFNTFFEWRPGF